MSRISFLLLKIYLGLVTQSNAWLSYNFFFFAKTLMLSDISFMHYTPDQIDLSINKLSDNKFEY